MKARILAAAVITVLLSLGVAYRLGASGVAPLPVTLSPGTQVNVTCSGLPTSARR